MSARNRPVKRILLFSLTPFYGGGEVYYFKFARLLRERYDLSAVVANQRLHEQFEALGIPSRLIPSRFRVSGTRYLEAAITLVKALRNDRPDLIHLNGQAETYFVLVARLFGVPVICTRHTPFDKRIHWLKRLAVSLNLHFVTRIVCVSEAIKTQLSTKVTEQRLVVIPNWVEPTPENTSYRPPEQDDVLRLLFVGRLVRDKGIFELLDAVRRTPNVSLDVVGDGPEMESAKAYSSDLPVTFHGFQANCQAFYRRAHLLVFPSHWEGQGFAPIEAMAYGLPTLISDIPTGVEASDHGSAAMLFRCGSVDDLADAMNELRDRPETLLRLSERGLQNVNERFTKEGVRGRYIDLIESLRENRPTQESASR